MMEINIHNVSKNYGFNNILKEINLSIQKGEKVSLIGSNGCGKTTLLKIISGIENPTEGEVSIRKGSTIGYLPQIPKLNDEDVLVKDILYESFKEVNELKDKMKAYENRLLESSDLKTLNAYGKIQEEFIKLDGYLIEEKINKIINKFKIDESLLKRKFSILSGGEKTIILFASLVLKHPDILLLDEPTNHLDIDTLEWLEEFLSTYDGTILIVSHDRYFLNKVCNKTVLIEKGCLEIFHGNYDYYLKENENRIMLEFKNYNNQQKQIEAMKKSIKKLREWGKIGDNEIFFKRANNIEKRLEKMEKFDKPSTKKELPISFDDNIRSGNDVLVVKDFSFKYSDKELFNNISFIIRYGERVCLLGENGSGKTTLINQIIENNSDNIKLGSNIKIGYIPQIIYFDDESKTVLETAREVFYGDETNLRLILFQFLFYGENIHKRINALSGGEKVRLKLFELIQQEINFLILDEPTNHIDIDTKEVLENALLKFKGTILLISHDRYFINKIVDKVLLIRDNKVKEYIGNYDDIKEKI